MTPANVAVKNKASKPANVVVVGEPKMEVTVVGSNSELTQALRNAIVQSQWFSGLAERDAAGFLLEVAVVGLGGNQIPGGVSGRM